MEESHTRNCERVQNLDSIARSLYTTAIGLVNDSMEAIRGYGKVVAALDVRQQSILRKSGPFVKPTTSKSSSKPGRDKTISYAMSSATSAAKKKRSRGKSRKIQGLLPHAAPPPFSPSATSTPAPAASPVCYGGLDTQKQYRQEAIRQFKSSKSGSSKELPCSPPREKQWKLPPSGSGSQGDLWDHLSRIQQQTSREGGSASQQANSMGAIPKDLGGVGCQGSQQSSSHHRGTI